VAYFGVHDPPTKLPPTPTERAARPQAMRALLRVAPIRRALLGTTVLTAAVGVLAGFLPGTAEALGAPASAVGGLFTAYAVVAAGIMLSPVAGRVDRSGADGPLALGLLTLGAALLLLSVAPTLTIALVGSALFGAGYGLIFPAVTAATSSSSTVATRGRAFGLFNVAFSLGLAVGPPLIGALAEAVPAIDPFVPTAVLAVAAALAITATAGRGPGTTHVDEVLDELGGPPTGP
jgi:MFS family permease